VPVINSPGERLTQRCGLAMEQTLARPSRSRTVVFSVSSRRSNIVPLGATERYSVLIW
jgi:hypothetical protein